jgi:aryl-alcohol dehydrogenase-like predicted oxidoreductase
MTTRASEIPRRRLGRTGLEITRIGCGGWQFGGIGHPGTSCGQDDHLRVATIRCALEVGIDWIDTASVYGFGDSERVVGRALRDASTRPLSLTKCGLIWDARGRVANSLHRKLREISCQNPRQASGCVVAN